MVNSSADDADPIGDDQAILLPEQGPEMREYTPRAKRSAPALWPQTLDPRQLPRTAETHPLSHMEHFWLVLALKNRPVVPTL